MDIEAYIQSGIIESYVLGLASAEENAEVEKLRQQYSAVEEAIESFSLALEEQAFRNAVTPPPGIKEKIWASIKEDMEEETAENIIPVAPLSSTTEGSPVVHITFYRKWRLAAAACFILLMCSAALNFFLFNKYSSRNHEYQALLSERNTLVASNQVYQAHLKEWQTAAEMMANPAMLQVAMKDPKSKAPHMATVFWDTRNKDVYVVTNVLPHPQPGKQYQLWALVDGKPVDAGVLDPECTGACKMKNIPKAQAFAITLEQQGGSNSPHLEALYVMGNV